MKTTKRLPSGKRRASILNSATKLFAKKGFRTTTAELAKSAGVSEPILYRHFESKKMLLDELLKEVIEKMGAAMETLAKQGKDPMDALLKIGQGYPLLASRYQSEFKLINRALAEAHDEDMAQLLRPHYDGYRELLTAIIREGQSKGMFRKVLSADIAAWHLIHSAIGYLLTRPLQGLGQDNENYEQQLAEMAVTGLLAEPKPSA